jgi:hypothetical protein
MFEEDLDDIPDSSVMQGSIDEDGMIADTYAMEEEAELEAMLSAYEARSPTQHHERPDSPLPSDDEYDSLFMDLLTNKESQHCGSNEDIVLSGQMDLS